MIVRATLVTDGPSDVILIRILEWVVAQMTQTQVEIRWADLRALRPKPAGLSRRLAAAIDLYPCEIVFVHRDAEAQDPQLRYNEIETANNTGCPHVCVVPVRMQEAWLLLDEDALRQAAGRPSGTEALNLPPIARWDRLPDPKAVLYAALRTANGAHGRRARSFRPERAAHRLAELVGDWTALRALAAFQRLETDMRGVLTSLGLI